MSTKCGYSNLELSQHWSHWPPRPPEHCCATMLKAYSVSIACPGCLLYGMFGTRLETPLDRQTFEGRLERHPERQTCKGGLERHVERQSQQAVLESNLRRQTHSCLRYTCMPALQMHMASACDTTCPQHVTHMCKAWTHPKAQPKMLHCKNLALPKKTCCSGRGPHPVVISS